MPAGLAVARQVQALEALVLLLARYIPYHSTTSCCLFLSMEPCAILYSLEHFGRVATHHASWWDVLGDYCAGCDCRAFADGHAGADDSCSSCNACRVNSRDLFPRQALSSPIQQSSSTTMGLEYSGPSMPLRSSGDKGCVAACMPHAQPLSRISIGKGCSNAHRIARPARQERGRQS